MPRRASCVLLSHTSRLTLAALLVLAVGVTAALQPAPAAAFVIWCWDDPLVEINGTRYNIENGVFGDPALVDKQIQIAKVVIHVPQGSRYQLLGVTREYFVEVVSFSESLPASAKAARVETTYVAQVNLPAAIRVNGSLIAQGSTQGGAITGSFSLK